MQLGGRQGVRLRGQSRPTILYFLPKGNIATNGADKHTHNHTNIQTFNQEQTNKNII